MMIFIKVGGLGISHMGGVQCRVFNSCTKCVGSPGIIHDRTSDCHLVFWAWMRPQVPDLTTERSFDSQGTWVIVVLGLFFHMLSIGVCKAMHR